MKKNVFIGTVILVLLLICAGTGAFLLFGSPFPHKGQANVVRQPLHTVYRSEEVPYTTHRALSMIANEQTTALLPWGIALDSLNGFIWVAEPGCQPDVQCPAIQPGALGQYAFSDGNLIQNLYQPDGYSSPLFTAVDSKGDVWFTLPVSDAIGEYNPHNQQWNQWFLKKGSEPFDLIFDRNGNLWYTGGFGGNIGEFNPHSGNETQFVVYQGTCSSPTNCTGTHISGISIDTKGDVWFTDSLSQRVGYLIPSTGQVVARTIDISNAHPYDGLMIDSSGRIWFTEEFESTLTMWPASADKS